MTQLLGIHPHNPQPRLIAHVIAALMQGGVIVYPTDATYALGCKITDKNALTRIQRIRQLDSKHAFTLVCRNLAELAIYAQVNDKAFRLLRSYIPGPYTFILPATKEVPKRLQHIKCKTIGLRVPQHPIVQAILAALQQPLMSTTLMLPNEMLPLSDPEDIFTRLGSKVEVVVDGGIGGTEATTVIDCCQDEPKLLRRVKGDFYA